jgi:molybdate transport system substrate-binding protein
VLAAGSLRAAMTDSAAAFEAAQPGVKVRLGFGASGLLKDRVAAGEAADVFASANMTHPEALAAAGKGGRCSASRAMRCARWRGRAWR